MKVHPYYTTRQNATHCSFTARQKLLGICHQFGCVHIKKEFFADYTLGYKNCGTRPVNSIWFFPLTGWCNFETPNSAYASWQTFDEIDILPIEFSCRMACGSHATLTSTLFSLGNATFCCILPHSIVWTHLKSK